MVNSTEYFLKADKKLHKQNNVVKISMNADQWMACRMVVSKTKSLFNKQFLFCQKRVKARIHTFFIQFVKNWQNKDGAIIRRMLRIFFFKDRSKSFGFKCLWKYTCWNERFIKYAKDCFKTSTWLCRIFKGMLRGSRWKMSLQHSFLNMF